ncbi:MAG: murein biosynthesis integral membrane protein MurJ, partial [Microcella sp.]|nr:murein biosynthesis integral membrane protein MurJ [Microcella sp.]
MNASAASDGGGIGRASVILASGTIVSRILGFVSAVLLTQTIGALGSGANTFALANQLPNSIYAIVAGGVLSAVLVPRIVRASVEEADGGQRFI